MTPWFRSLNATTALRNLPWRWMLFSLFYCFLTHCCFSVTCRAMPSNLDQMFFPLIWLVNWSRWFGMACHVTEKQQWVRGKEERRRSSIKTKLEIKLKGRNKRKLRIEKKLDSFCHFSSFQTHLAFSHSSFLVVGKAPSFVWKEERDRKTFLISFQ